MGIVNYCQVFFFGVQIEWQDYLLDLFIYKYYCVFKMFGLHLTAAVIYIV